MGLLSRIQRFSSHIDFERIKTIAENDEIEVALDTLIQELETNDLHLPMGYWKRINEIGKSATGEIDYLGNRITAQNCVQEIN